MGKGQVKMFNEVLKEGAKEIKYKDSEKARFFEEEGDPNEDVIVKDRFKNGKAITFIWKREKSNKNTKTIGKGKQGFSFYHARHVHRDPYLHKEFEKNTNSGSSSVVGTVSKHDKEIILVIKEEYEGKDEEGDPKIRIFSATYASVKVQIAYFQNALEIATRNGGGLERLEDPSCSDDYIAFTTMKHRKT
jgi:hypothetical protein